MSKKKKKPGSTTITRYVMTWSTFYVVFIAVVLIIAITILGEGASLNWVLVLVIIFAAAIMIVSQRIFSRRLSITLNKMRANAQFIGTKIDFSERMKADSQFEEINVLIDTYNRLLDKMEQTINRERAFNSSVSHELRTPISVIKAECEIAREKQKNGYVNVNEVLDLVERQNGRMYSLVNQLLAISRLEQGRIQIQDDEEIDLAELAEIICEEEAEIQGLNAPSDLFEMVLAPAKVTANMTLIMTLYTNLVHNAVKYNKNNNKITVQLWKEQQSVFFSVQDWGIGMSENVRENIFNSFYRAEKSRTSEGFGLGLTMAGRIAEYYGGEIEVSSKEGFGSTFTASLPLIK